MSGDGARRRRPRVPHLAQNQAAKVEQIEKLVKDQAAARKRAEAKIAAVKKEIQDVTPQAHNGCRPPKRRRV